MFYLDVPGRVVDVQFLDLTLATPQENLALDEALLTAAESEGPVEFLRLWESGSHAVVLGKNCRISDDVCVANCRADSMPIVRRFTGGGTVLIGPGCLNFSVILRYDRAPGLDDITRSYRYVLERVCDALEPWVPGLELLGTSDLARENYKVCGNAQRRQRTHFLHHGSILVDFDLPRIARYLKEPRRQPAYRAERAHLDFLKNLGVKSEQIRVGLRGSWKATEPARNWPEQLVARLARDKYSDPAWTHAR